MQETQETLNLNLTLGNEPVSQIPTLPRGLVSPYQQQAHDFNNMVEHHQMTTTLQNQIKNLEERAVFCLKIKDKVIEEFERRTKDLETRLKLAVEEAASWKTTAVQNSELVKELAGKCLELKRKERSREVKKEIKNEIKNEVGDDEAESCIGDNGRDVVNSKWKNWKTRSAKRRREKTRESWFVPM